MIPDHKFLDFAESEIIPKILAIMEEAGISANQAIRIAPILSRVVEDKNCKLMCCVRFRANPEEWAKSLSDN